MVRASPSGVRPPTTAGRPVEGSVASCAWVRGDVLASSVQRDPSHAHVSPRSPTLGRTPPNTITRLDAASYVIAWWTRGGGPFTAARVQTVPSHSHVSF